MQGTSRASKPVPRAGVPVPDMMTFLAWQIEQFDRTASEERREAIFAEIEATIRNILAAVDYTGRG
jgi:hypothetical protein